MLELKCFHNAQTHPGSAREILHLKVPGPWRDLEQIEHGQAGPERRRATKRPNAGVLVKLSNRSEPLTPVRSDPRQ